MPNQIIYTIKLRDNRHKHNLQEKNDKRKQLVVLWSFLEKHLHLGDTLNIEQSKVVNHFASSELNFGKSRSFFEVGPHSRKSTEINSPNCEV